MCLAVFKTVARAASCSRVGSTPMHLRHSILNSKLGSIRSEFRARCAASPDALISPFFGICCQFAAKWVSDSVRRACAAEPRPAGLVADHPSDPLPNSVCTGTTTFQAGRHSGDPRNSPILSR